MSDMTTLYTTYLDLAQRESAIKDGLKDIRESRAATLDEIIKAALIGPDETLRTYASAIDTGQAQLEENAEQLKELRRQHHEIYAAVKAASHGSTATEIAGLVADLTAKEDEIAELTGLKRDISAALKASTKGLLKAIESLF